MKAARDGDIATISKLLDSGVYINSNSSEDEGRSALSSGAGAGQLAAVQFLLDRGADVNADDAWGGNALTEASVNGNVDIVKLLVAHGADPNADDDGATALGYASYQLENHETSAPLANYRAIVKILQDNGGRQSFDIPGWVLSGFN